MNFKIVILLFLSAVFGERIVTDWNDIKSGVPLDYTYNQTSTTTGLISAPGCPKSENDSPWVLYGKANPRCYRVGESFPCAFPATLHIQLGSPFGVCKFNPSDCEPEDGLLRPPRPQNSRYSYCIPIDVLCQEFVYDNIEDKVHELYRKLTGDGVSSPDDPCSAKDEWLEPDMKGGVVCAPKKCPADYTLITKKYDEDSKIFEISEPCCSPQELQDSGSPQDLQGSGNPNLQANKCSEGHSYDEKLQKCIEERASSKII